jgi:Na+/H+-dicarboxylate symporter
MPIIIILLLAAMVATFGFWATLKGILGAIGVIVLLCLLVVLTVSFLAAWLLKR